ncbi:MAG: Threonine-tRNA ligase [Parcubacteria group bacterium GW2011_GWB1_57_6]|nr:MAG: Threonine-tRNA ligase [Parcubacteria group bacterium GW2011_GWB1_57_6]
MDANKTDDHKKLGKELDLFTFSDLVGSGLPLWTPKGTILRNLLDEFVWELRRKNGYEKVEIPHITKRELYEKSGHWEKWDEFALKPMNCPHHTQIYARKPWSYRELPQRYANTTMCYRDEQSGELNGLSRVRAFTQDDAHCFCRESQVKEEFLKIWDIIEEFYSTLGFKPKKIRLSFHDQNHPEKYLGDKKHWKTAEDILSDIAKEKGAETIDGVGEAAFYGPKLDFMAEDAHGRLWQVATIQLDMNMPERFDLTCTNEQGQRERIVMIHAAVMGSIERFLSVLIEHVGGAFPFWLSPVQAKVLGVSEKHAGYVREVVAALKTAHIRAEMDDANESLGKKIRNAKSEKIPYLLVVGDKEVEARTVSVESRNDGKQDAMPLADFIARANAEIAQRK